MRLPNGVGTVYKLSGNRRNPYIVRKTIGWELNEKGDKVKQKFMTIGYAPTKEEGLIMLMNYNESEAHEKQTSKRFLEEILADGEMLQKDIIKIGKERGYSEKTLQNSKYELDIKSVKIDNQWYWQLESQADCNKQTEADEK